MIKVNPEITENKKADNAPSQVKGQSYLLNEPIKDSVSFSSSNLIDKHKKKNNSLGWILGIGAVVGAIVIAVSSKGKAKTSSASKEIGKNGKKFISSSGSSSRTSSSSGSSRYSRSSSSGSSRRSQRTHREDFDGDSWYKDWEKKQEKEDKKYWDNWYKDWEKRKQEDQQWQDEWKKSQEKGEQKRNSYRDKYGNGNENSEKDSGFGGGSNSSSNSGGHGSGSAGGSTGGSKNGGSTGGNSSGGSSGSGNAGGSSGSGFNFGAPSRAEQLINRQKDGLSTLLKYAKENNIDIEGVDIHKLTLDDLKDSKNQDAVKRLYRKLAKQFHTDKGVEDREDIQKITEAYDFIICPERNFKQQY